MQPVTRVLVIPLVAGIGLTACSSAPPTEAEIMNEVVATATVRAIDRATREVTLEREDGSRLIVTAGPEVRNFDRIETGDTVRARYVEMLSARRLAPDEVGAEPVGVLGAGRAEAGAPPAAALGMGIAMTVRVESVDLAQNLVTFTDPDGRLRAVRAQRDEGKAFIRGLKPGDRVELNYGEAVILTVE